MIKDIIDGISIKLNQAFGDDYTIYVDTIPNGFKTPSFYIQLVDMQYVRQIGNRWYVAPLFNIQYFTDLERSDISYKSLPIQQALERITLVNGDIIIGRAMESNTTTEFLNNFVRYDFYLNEERAKNFMQSLDLSTRVVEVDRID